MVSAIRRRFPILTNLYVGQVLFGALATVLVTALVRHYAGEAPLARFGLGMRWIGLGLLVLAFGVYLQNVHRFGLVPDYSLKCRSCNGPVNRYSEFCEHCGFDLIAEEKLVPCPKCGVEVYEETKHCPECGTRLRASRGKGKGKGKGKAKPEPTEGWATPVDAVSGFPPEDERR